MKLAWLILSFCCFIFLTYCNSDEESMKKSVELVSINANGASFQDGSQNIVLNTIIQLVFSESIDQQAFRSNFSITTSGQVVGYNLTFSNASSLVSIDPELEYGTVYELTLKAGQIGQNEGSLKNDLIISFETTADETIREAEPCTSSCIRTASFTLNNAVSTFDFYSNYPIYEEKASWENLKNAIIVIHGVNRNANEYFSYLSSTLSAESLQEKTILIAPFFKNTEEAENTDLYWNGSGWREGQNSPNTNLSSFSVLDSLISQLSRSDLFPVLENIVITGHSSGGLFTQVYGASNNIASAHPSLSFIYIVANSQYFYYPNDFRYDEGTQSYFKPSSCTLYNSWPLGFNNVPSYLSSTTQNSLNDQYLDRKIIYLLGNGSGSDPSLNTSNCDATLLGSTRYKRGVNAYQHTQNYFVNNNHERVIVEGIDHDGQAMYTSTEFKQLLQERFQ